MPHCQALRAITWTYLHNVCTCSLSAFKLFELEEFPLTKSWHYFYKIMICNLAQHITLSFYYVYMSMCRGLVHTLACVFNFYVSGRLNVTFSISDTKRPRPSAFRSDENKVVISCAAMLSAVKSFRSRRDGFKSAALSLHLKVLTNLKNSEDWYTKQTFRWVRRWRQTSNTNYNKKIVFCTG